MLKGLLRVWFLPVLADTFLLYSVAGGIIRIYNAAGVKRKLLGKVSEGKQNYEAVKQQVFTLIIDLLVWKSYGGGCREQKILADSEGDG